MWGEGAAGQPRRRTALSPPTPFPPWSQAALRPGSLLGAPKRAPQLCCPALGAAPRSGSSSAFPRHSTCARRGREGAGPPRATLPMGVRNPPPRVRIYCAGGRSFEAPEPAKRGDCHARRGPRRRSRGLQHVWGPWRFSGSWRCRAGDPRVPGDPPPRCRRGRRAWPCLRIAGVAHLWARTFLSVRVISAQTGFSAWMRDDLGFMNYLHVYRDLERK